MKPNIPQPVNVKSCFHAIADEFVKLHKQSKDMEKKLNELKKQARDIAVKERGTDMTVDGVEIRGIQPNVRMLVSLVCSKVSFNEGVSPVDMKRAQILLGNDVLEIKENVSLKDGRSVASLMNEIGEDKFERFLIVDNDIKFNGALYDRWVIQNEAERKRNANQTANQSLDFIKSVVTAKEDTPKVSA
jgi:hypothetical protein